LTGVLGATFGGGGVFGVSYSPDNFSSARYIGDGNDVGSGITGESVQSGYNYTIAYAPNGLSTTGINDGDEGTMFHANPDEVNSGSLYRTYGGNPGNSTSDYVNTYIVVDLGSVQPIKQVTVLPRQDGTLGGNGNLCDVPIDYTVWTSSNTNAVSGSNYAFLKNIRTNGSFTAQKVVKGSADTQHRRVVTLDNVVNARYVAFSSENFVRTYTNGNNKGVASPQYFSMCELTVHGDVYYNDGVIDTANLAAKGDIRNWSSGTAITTEAQLTSFFSSNPQNGIGYLANDITVDISTRATIADNIKRGDQRSFSGTLYGNGHTITYSGMTSGDATAGSEIWYTGTSCLGLLTGYLKGGKMYDFNVVMNGDFILWMTSGSTSAYQRYTGILAGLSESGSVVDNVHITLNQSFGDFDYATGSSNSGVGTSVGAFFGGTKDGGSTIQNSSLNFGPEGVLFARASSYSNTESATSDGRRGSAGGFIGELWGTNTNAGTVSINNCAIRSNSSGAGVIMALWGDTRSSGREHVGGIVGNMKDNNICNLVINNLLYDYQGYIAASNKNSNERRNFVVGNNNGSDRTMRISNVYRSADLPAQPKIGYLNTNRYGGTSRSLTNSSPAGGQPNGFVYEWTLANGEALPNNNRTADGYGVNHSNYGTYENRLTRDTTVSAAYGYLFHYPTIVSGGYGMSTTAKVYQPTGGTRYLSAYNNRSNSRTYHTPTDALTTNTYKAAVALDTSYVNNIKGYVMDGVSGGVNFSAGYRLGTGGVMGVVNGPVANQTFEYAGNKEYYLSFAFTGIDGLNASNSNITYYLRLVGNTSKTGSTSARGAEIGSGYELGNYSAAIYYSTNGGANLTQLSAGNYITGTNGSNIGVSFFQISQTELNKIVKNASYNEFSIIKKDISINIINEQGKEYDATTNADGKYTINFVGYVNSAGASAQPSSPNEYTSSGAYSRSQVGTVNISASVSVIGGSYLDKYFNIVGETNPSSGNVAISRKTLTFSVANPNGKTYDGTTNADAYNSGIIVSGYLDPVSGQTASPDSSQYTFGTPVYSSKDAGTRTIDALVTVILSSDMFKNYKTASLNAFSSVNNVFKVSSTFVTISSRNIYFTVSGESKEYDATAAVKNGALNFVGYIKEGAEGQPTSGFEILNIGYGAKGAYESHAIDVGSYALNAKISITPGSDFDLNFNLSSVNVTTEAIYEIRQREIAFVVNALNGRPYNGTDVVGVSDYTAAFEGYLTADGAAQPTGQFSVLSVKYSDKNAVQVYVVVNISVNAGSDLEKNFSFAKGDIYSGTQVVISKIMLNATAKLDEATKVYDGTRNAKGSVDLTGFIAGEKFVLNTDYTVSVLYDDFYELKASGMPVRISFEVYSNDLTKNYDWADSSSAFPIFYAGMTRRPLDIAAAIPEKVYDGKTKIEEYELVFNGFVPHYSVEDQDARPEAGVDYIIGEMRYFFPDVSDEQYAYANFKLLETSKYFNFYTVAGEHTDTSIVVYGKITPKEISGEFNAGEIEYGELFSPSFSVEGVTFETVDARNGTTEIVTGWFDLSPIYEGIANGEYSVGDRSVELKLNLYGQWQNNYYSDKILVKFTVIKRTVRLEVGALGETFTFNGSDYTNEAAGLASVNKGVNDEVNFGDCLKIVSVKRNNPAIIKNHGEEALNNAVFADTYFVYYGVEQSDLDNALANYNLEGLDEEYAVIVVERAEIPFEYDRKDGVLTIQNPEGYDVRFVLDDGQTFEGVVDQTEFDVNKYRAYKISAVMEGDDAFRYVGTVADSAAEESFVAAVAANVGETAAAGALGYLIYLLVAALKKAQKAQTSFEKMKTASDARRLAAYRADVKRIQGTKETSAFVQRQGAKATSQNVVKKPKYPTYPDRVDLDLVPRTVPKGYSPVLKNQTVPKGKIKK
jgi:hypothetical protein